MVFSCPEFLFFFLPIFLIIYFIAPYRLKNLTLLIASLIFYAWGEPVYVVLLIFSSVVDYTNGRLIEKFGKNKRLRKLFLILSIVINLSLLGVFKYAGFIGENLRIFMPDIKVTALPLPIGISFFTFQTMSYSIDVYRGKIKAEKSFLCFMTYVCMFPQLIAGPIVRFSDISSELHKRAPSFEDFYCGITRFMNGLFKKVLIADELGLLWSVIKGSEYSSLPALTAWLGAVSFTLQLYFDFSGYADMAVGLGRIMGFHYCENFNHPLAAVSVTDFWRRWHMSLSEWFRDYVYIPLGGNRCSVQRHIFNILAVWCLTGIWHGASWNFALWGLYYGVLLVCEKYIWGKSLKKLPSPFAHLYALFIIVVGFAIFDIEGLENILGYFGAMFSGSSLFDKSTLYYIVNYGRVLTAAVIFSAPLYGAYEKMKNGLSSPGKKALALLVEWGLRCFLFAAVIASLISRSYSPFLYFRF